MHVGGFTLGRLRLLEINVTTCYNSMSELAKYVCGARVVFYGQGEVMSH